MKICHKTILDLLKDGPIQFFRLGDMLSQGYESNYLFAGYVLAKMEEDGLIQSTYKNPDNLNEEGCVWYMELVK